METEPTAERKSKTGRRAPRIRGLQEDAKHLGVTRVHLRYVLSGYRHSPGLMARYRALQSERVEKLSLPIPSNSTPTHEYRIT